MLTIPNLPTQDRYVDALTLGPVPAARMIKYVVANKSVFARVWPQSKSGTIPAQTDELLITPETNIITDAMGIQFRSAVAGVPAQVIAQLLEPGDPTLGSGTPFSSTISSTGGITPGTSSVQIQKDGNLIAAEPTLDFLTTGSMFGLIADDPANARVTVGLPRVLMGLVSSAGGVVHGAGFTVTKLGTGNYQINFTAPFAAVPIVLALPGNTGGLITSSEYGNPGLSTVQVFTSSGGALVDCEFMFIAVGL